jgi:hypothetical protein
MGLLDNTTQQQYYQGTDYGTYQFTSLDDIITQFMISYVGEDKIISKIKRTDVAFHAQRAMQELSFDTFKSIKSQEIEVPATLQMVLPQDYVNYTKISRVDSSGIKHPLYPTSRTSNPTNPYQTVAAFEIRAKGTITGTKKAMTLDAQYDNILIGMVVSGVGIVPGTTVEASQVSSGVTLLTLSTALDLTTDSIAASNVTVNDAEYIFTLADGSLIQTPDTQVLTEIAEIAIGKAYIDFATALTGVSVGDLVSHEYFPVGTVITGIAAQTGAAVGTRIFVSNTTTTTSALENQEITFTSVSPTSDTWTNYKSATPSENQDDYQDDTYWPLDGSRYGLDPQHSQVNGSFYIDSANGKIHFSSNISGKTIILDYISDGLGTDEEMQVHKFAEEAMYKSIAHAIMSARANVPEYQVNRFKKEKFAAVRTAKLRLSNIKLEELTQTLRGKSKHIKH